MKERYVRQHWMKRMKDMEDKIKEEKYETEGNIEEEEKDTVGNERTRRRIYVKGNIKEEKGYSRQHTVEYEKNKKEKKRRRTQKGCIPKTTT